jgi:hypothetical protein
MLTISAHWPPIPPLIGRLTTESLDSLFPRTLTFLYTFHHSIEFRSQPLVLLIDFLLHITAHHVFEISIQSGATAEARKLLLLQTPELLQSSKLRALSTSNP